MVFDNKKGIGKVLKIFLWSFAVIGLLLIVFFAYIFISVMGSDESIDEINVIWNDYSDVFNKFSTEYSVADPSSVTSLSFVPRARTGIVGAQNYLVVMKANATQITTKVGLIKADYKDEELDWLNSVEKCFNGELSRIALYEEILVNGKQYLDYYEYDDNYTKTYEELGNILLSYSANVESGDENGIVDDLNKARVKVLLLKQYSQQAYEAIPFVYYQKANAWAIKYLEALDLELKYWASPSTDLAKQAMDKYDDATKALDGLTTGSVTEEFDSWYNEKITLKQDEVDRIYTQIDSDCSNANDLFETAFPGNANVVKNVDIQN